MKTGFAIHGAILMFDSLKLGREQPQHFFGV